MIDLQRAKLACKPGGAVLAFGGGGILNRGAQQSSSTATSTSNTDNRIAAEGSTVAGAGGYASNFADNSTNFQVADSSNRSSSSSNSGNTTITNTGTDAAQVVSLTAQLQAALGESQSDATRAIASFGTDAIRQLGASVTDLYEQAGQNTATSWGNTVSASEKLISSLLDTAKSTSDASQITARAAISAYTPPESTTAAGMADAMKYGALAVAALVAFYVLKKA